MNLSDDGTIVAESDDECTEDESGNEIFVDSIFKPSIKTMEYADIKNDDIVELSAIEDYKTVYIRSIKHDEKWIDLLVKMNKTVRNQPKLSMFAPLKKNDVVLVKYLGDFTRASLIGEDRLRLIDIGTTIKFQADDVRYISTEVFAEKKMAVPVVLKLPSELSPNEESAVKSNLSKHLHKRFVVCSSTNVVENTIVDLKHTENNRSLTIECMNHVEVKMSVKDIQKKKVNAQNVDVVVIDNSHLSKGFVCCVLMDDADLFATQVKSLSEYCETLASDDPYTPSKFELCLVLYPDENQERLWYRAQYQQTLTNNRAQVGLIDFASEVTVPMCNIRKFDPLNVYERISLVCKVRNDEISMDLLDHTQFAEFQQFNATRIRPVGDDQHEIFVSNNFFLDEDFD